MRRSLLSPFVVAAAAAQNVLTAYVPISGLSCPPYEDNALVLYPSSIFEDGQMPLLVFAHGTNVSPEGYLPLLTTLAEAGYIVVAPHSAPIGWCEQQYLDQQRVAEVAADRELWAPGTAWLWDAVDTSKIGAVGHSMGGFATAVNAATEFFKAAVSYAPYYDGFSDEAPLATTPIFYVSGSLDPIVSPQETINYYYNTNDTVPKVGAVVQGYDHLTMVAEAPFAYTFVVAFFDCYLRDETARCATIRDTLCTSPEYFPMYFCDYDDLLLVRQPREETLVSKKTTHSR